MKRYLYLFLLAALVCGCNDSEGDNSSGTEPQQPVSPDEILPRRLVSADATLVSDDRSYSYAFSYDGQGRLSSIVCSTVGYADNEEVFSYEDDIIVAGETTFQLQNGRALTARYEETEYDWGSETTFSYDAAGYLTSMVEKISNGATESYTVDYGQDGISSAWRSSEGTDGSLTVEYDRTQLNNLNLDLYGWNLFTESFQTSWTTARLLGIGGRRLPCLPTTISGSDVDKGSSYTWMFRYVYQMDGDYLSEVRIYCAYDGGEEKEVTRLAFHYE